MAIKAVIFDFDGTLADSLTVFTEAIVATLKRSAFTEQEVAMLREHSTREIIRLLGVPKWRVPFLIPKGMKEIDRRQDRITVFAGISDMLQQLHNKNYKLFIVSSHYEQGIEIFLKQYDLAKYIDQIYAKVGLFGKARALKQLQKQHSYQADQCLFVGDETRDVEAARKAGIRCIAVTWGFNTAEAFETHQPDSFADKPEDIVKILLSSNNGTSA